MVNMKNFYLKKLTAAILTVATATAILLPLSSCLKPIKKPELPKWDSNVTLKDGGAEIVWDEVPSAVSYKVYYSPGRFGEYSFIRSLTELSYFGEDEYGYYRVDAENADGEVVSSELYSYDLDTFGENVRVYSPDDNQTEIQEDIDEFRYSTGQFSDKRFAALFKKGKYNSLDLVMRYYMTFSGMGNLPTDVEIGKFNTHGELSGGNATCNFWCGIENITVNDTVQWAVSQATSFRRMKVNGGMFLTDQNGKTAWGSGGFIANTLVTGTLDSGNQQQWITRNSQWGTWRNGDINMVYAGCEGKFADAGYVWPEKRITTLEYTSAMREKPYLVFDEDYYVAFPELKENSKGYSWETDENALLSIEEFYVARADRDTSETLNAALENGKHLLFTPGIYAIDGPLNVKNPNTVLLGMGLATLKLTDKNTDTAIRISDVDGVSVYGLMIDAGKRSRTLMEVGENKTGVSHVENPVVIGDMYFRIGGAGDGSTAVDKALIINSNNVIGDNFWVWRADHGNKGTVGWEINKAVNGVIVNGDDVTVYGLMVEHFQEYQTIWNGENGLTVFYQSETPYDPPEQKVWKSEWNGTVYEGWASYKVADKVQKHRARGVGVYYVASKGLNNMFNLDHGIEAPSNSGIDLEHMAIANFLTNGGGIRHIVNQYGKELFVANGTKNQWTSFKGGIAVE